MSTANPGADRRRDGILIVLVCQLLPLRRDLRRTAELRIIFVGFVFGFFIYVGLFG
jgi:hypothetical protein